MGDGRWEMGKWRLGRVGAPAGWLGESCSGLQQSKRGVQRGDRSCGGGGDESGRKIGGRKIGEGDGGLFMKVVCGIVG
jgi:hypothetical protein